jgi:hypothetical protein
MVARVKRARSGFDGMRRLETACRGWSAGLFNKPTTNTEGTTNMDLAPSVAQADAILAKFGYAEKGALAAA